MRLRSGTLIEFFDPTRIPSEMAIGELCAIIGECGYEISGVADTWRATIVEFESKVPTVNGSIKIDRTQGLFNVIVLDTEGSLHQVVTTDDARAFDFMSRQVAPHIGGLFEEVDIREKYKSLAEPARGLLSWMLEQYRTAGIYVFSPSDLGSDMEISSKDEAVDSLIEQGFLRMSNKDALVLDRTLADDLRSGEAAGAEPKPETDDDSGDHLDGL